MINRQDVETLRLHFADGGKHAFRVGDILPGTGRGVHQGETPNHAAHGRPGVSGNPTGQEATTFVGQFPQGLGDHFLVEPPGQLQAKWH